MEAEFCRLTNYKNELEQQKREENNAKRLVLVAAALTGILANPRGYWDVSSTVRVARNAIAYANETLTQLP